MEKITKIYVKTPKSKKTRMVVKREISLCENLYNHIEPLTPKPQAHPETRPSATNPR